MNKHIELIYVRNEYNELEHRTPIIPIHIPILLKLGFIIYIQSSNHRIYSDKEYLFNGAIITDMNWYEPLFKNALIIGLKDIKQIDKLSNHKHLYFSHSYKNQQGYEQILSAFYKSNSVIYDFEYFIDSKNKRIISFGFYAGIMGCVLGLLQYLKKSLYNKNISQLHYWETKEEIIEYLYNNIRIFNKLSFAIIGANGNCGMGVKSILDKLNIKYDMFGKNSDKSLLTEYDIVYNCIVLDEESTEIWFDKNTKFKKPIIITDISCDYSKTNNPIQLYSENTTWEIPVYSYNSNVDIIAINNLPSLLPKESSDYFSSKCIELLRDINIDTCNYWGNVENIFYKKLKPIELIL